MLPPAYYKLASDTALTGAWGGVVVKALRYLSDGLGIDPQWGR